MNTNTISSCTLLNLFFALFVSLLLILFPMRGSAADVEFRVNFNDPPTDLEMFWNGSGVNRRTADYNSGVMHQNMLLVGSIPYQGSLHQRPHDLLDLVTDCADLESIPEQCDWSHLDDFLDVIVVSGQKLFFELMGNPSNLFNFDRFYEQEEQREAWKRLVEGLALRLIERYGLDEVRSWYFQTWNESYKKWARLADIGDPKYERGWKDFLAYYNASWAGLMAADPELRFGGPALQQITDGREENKVEWGNRLINSGSKLDYASYHNKKNRRTITRWISDEISALKKLDLENIQSDNSFMVFNEEADSESGWWKNLDHRATPWYAAFIARQVHEYLSRVVNGEGIIGVSKGLDFRLANDNAFLNVRDPSLLGRLPNSRAPAGAWKQRTHFAHFGDDQQNFALIKKPAHNVMTMLSLLGDRKYVVTPDEISNGLGAIATSWREDQVAILIYHYLEEFENQPSSKNVRLNLVNLPFPEGKLTHYRLDKNHANTYQDWLDMGSPEIPSDDQIQVLRNRHELGLFKTNPGFDLSQDNVTLDFDLPAPGVSLILISKRPARTRPVQVTGLYAETFRSLNDNTDEVLLRWDSNSRFIRNYKVFFSDSEAGPFRKINTVNLISTAYIHQLAEPIPESGVYYRVSAVNYWGRTGKVSDVIHVTKRETRIEKEAEGYSALQGAWKSANSTSASGNVYMVVPKGTGNDRRCAGLSLQNYMEYGFNAPSNGEYYIWIRGYGNGGGDDSICVSIDSGPLMRLDIAQNAWKWQRLAAPTNLMQDSETRLRIHLREDNTYVDKIIITPDAQFVPTS